MKNSQNLFSIGEMAKAINVTRRMILNYEEKGLIQPDEKDPITGNRYYSIDTFTRLRSIRSFQNLGLSLDEIGDYFNDTADLLPLVRRLERLRDELNLNIERLYERVNTGSETIKAIRLERQRVYLRRYRASSIAEKTELLRQTALEALRAHNSDISRRMYFIEYPLTDPEDVSFCVAVLPESEGDFVESTESAWAVSLFHHGDYTEIPAVAKRLLIYAKEKGLTPTGILRHTYLEGPPQHKSPSKFITQIALPVESL